MGSDNGGVNADRRRFEAEMISGLKGDAYRTILNNPKLNTNQQNYAFEEIRRLDTAAEYATNANATAVKQANDRAANGYVSQGSVSTRRMKLLTYYGRIQHRK